MSVIELADSEVAERFERVLGDEFDLPSDEDLETVAQGLAPASSALVLVWENAWATRLASAVREPNGQVLFMERVPRDGVERAVAALAEKQGGEPCGSRGRPGRPAHRAVRTEGPGSAHRRGVRGGEGPGPRRVSVLRVGRADPPDPNETA